MWASLINHQYPSKYRQGFTIVELLIVIVVIGILAAITIVAFNGVQNRAKVGAVQSALAQVNKKILAYAVTNSDQYPPDLAAAGVANGDTNFQYSVNNNASPRTYGLTATNGAFSYYVSNATTQSTLGGYPGHGTAGTATITNLILNPSAETNATFIAGAGGGVAISRDTSQSFFGVASIRAVTDGTIVGSGTQHLTTTGSYPAGTYRASLYIKGTAGAQVYGLLRPYGSGGADTVTPATTMTGAWQRLELPTMTVISSTTTQFSLMIRTVTAIATTFWVDGAMLVEGSNIYTYADGSSSNWAWNGTAHNATSTGMPL